MKMKVQLAAALLILAGCGGSGDGGATTIDSNGGRYRVRLSTSPAPIQLNQPFNVLLTVTPKTGSAADLEVMVDARMPAHFHGMSRVPKLTRSGADSWKAEGLLFHMSGHWELYVDITQGGGTERAQIDVDLK